MNKEELIIQAHRIRNKIRTDYHSSLFQAREFLKTYGGPNNTFYEVISKPRKGTVENHIPIVSSTLLSFIEYIENDLLRTISLEREIQIETVSDYLSQAESLLMNKNIHPAAPAVIIGASLEEFLRNWLEEEGTDLANIKHNLDSYSKELKSKDLITKQDIKDLTSWGGIRNDAAHGLWESVEDRNRIKLMLEGVNLFMRKYGIN